VVAGPFIVILVIGLREIREPDPGTLLSRGRPDRAVARIHSMMPSLRKMAKVWPGQFGDAPADRLIILAAALHAMHRDREALLTAAEAVAIYQDLAAQRPGKYAFGLADALERQSRMLAAAGRPAEALAAAEVATRLYRDLAATKPACLLVLAEYLTCQVDWLAELDKESDAKAVADEASAIYEDRLPSQQVPSREARALLLEGEFLCRQGRYREAVMPLATGWHAASPKCQQDALWQAAPALRAAYHADPDGFAAVWHAETGGDPPGWLRD
jgi:hypothetical protein